MSNPAEAQQDSNTPIPIAVMEHVDAIEEIASLDEIDPDNYQEDLEDVPVIHLQAIQPEESAPSSPTSDEGVETLVLEAIDLEEGEDYGATLANPPNISGIPQAAAIATESTRNVLEDSTFISSRDVAIRDGTSRAQFISVLLAPIAGHNNASIGIRFFPDHAGKVARIEDGSILSHSPLRAGDELVRINGKACHQKSSREIAALILESRGRYLNMVFENPMEDAHVGLVHCMLMKRTPEDTLSIKLGNFTGGEVRITEISPNGIAGKSLLNVGDTILEVNGTSCTDYSTTSEVVYMLSTEPKYVNILVRTGANTAVMVSEVSTRMTHVPSVNTTGVADLDAAGNKKCVGSVAGFCFLGVALIVILTVALNDPSNPYEYTQYPDSCTYISGHAEHMAFEFNNDIQTSGLFATFYNNTNATAAFNNTNDNVDISHMMNKSENVIQVVSSMVGYFSLNRNDGESIEIPTNVEIDQVLQNTSEFFALALEGDLGTADAFLSLRLYFQSWTFSSCDYYDNSADLDMNVMLEANFSRIHLDDRFSDLNTTERLNSYVASVLSQATSDRYYTYDDDYMEDYVRTVGNESGFGATYYVGWSEIYSY